MKRFSWVILVLVFGLSTSCQKKADRSQPMQQDTIPVKLQKIQKTAIASAFEVSGYFTTNDETPLSFLNGGIIEKIYVDEGDEVKAGQLLAKVKGVETQSASQQAELAYQKAQRDYDRAARLYQDSVATLEQMQNAKTALEVANQQKSTADFNQNQSVIKAAKNGFVLKKFVKAGQIVGSGTPVILMSSSQNNDWIFKMSLSDSQWAAVQIGDSARVKTDMGSEQSAPAVVSSKTEGIDPETGGFSVQLKLKNDSKLQLATGLFGEATIYPSQKSEGWYIPYDALLDGDEDYGFVFVTNDRQTVKKQKVHIAEVHHNKVLVDRGLEEYKYLIISGSAYLREESIIQIKD